MILTPPSSAKKTLRARCFVIVNIINEFTNLMKWTFLSSSTTKNKSKASSLRAKQLLPSHRKLVDRKRKQTSGVVDVWFERSWKILHRFAFRGKEMFLVRYDPGNWEWPSTESSRRTNNLQIPTRVKVVDFILKNYTQKYLIIEHWKTLGGSPRMERKMQRFNWILKQSSTLLIWSSSLLLSDQLLCLSNVHTILERRGTFIDTLHRTVLNLSRMFWPSQKISPTLFAIIATPVSNHLRTVKWSSEFFRQTWTLKILTPITCKTCWKWQIFESTLHDCIHSVTICSTTDLRFMKNTTTPSQTWLFVAHVLAMDMLHAVCRWKDSTHKTTWFMDDVNVRTTLKVSTVSIVKTFTTTCRGNLHWASKQMPAKVSYKHASVTINRFTFNLSECNCNNHAVSCHFDQAVYEHSGRVSGGVCDNCEHNTQGQHCEQCMPFFYRDPNEDIQSPYVCKSCDCDPIGSLDDGICDSVSDVESEIEAGACHCKTHVKGRRCDICREGFWNLTETNPDGCEECTCNIEGTVNNLGCNFYSGECTCKRLVMGRDCNQCMPETFGLSESRDGCTQCECDPGGSLDNNCDVITGQCKCRQYMQGRDCSEPRQNHFIPSLHIISEAEGSSTVSQNFSCHDPQIFLTFVFILDLWRRIKLRCKFINLFLRIVVLISIFIQNCSIVVRDPYPDRPPSWTGPGFLKVYEGGDISFTIDNVPKTMNYDVQLRYSPQIRGSWEDVRVSVIRPDAIGHDSACYNINPLEEQEQTLRLNEYDTHTIALQDLCLEEGKTYKFIVSFHRQSSYEQNPKAQILVDSVNFINSLLSTFINLRTDCSSSWFLVLKSRQSSRAPRQPTTESKTLIIIAATTPTTMFHREMSTRNAKNCSRWLELWSITEPHVSQKEFVKWPNASRFQIVILSWKKIFMIPHNFFFRNSKKKPAAMQNLLFFTVCLTLLTLSCGEDSAARKQLSLVI